nr:helix-turn-helix domain-containing protein [Clostridia bacterium]
HSYSFFRGMGTVLLFGQQHGGAYLAEENWLEKLKESVANSRLLDARDRVDRLFLHYQQNERTPVAHIVHMAKRIADLLEAKHGHYLPNKPLLTPEERQHWIEQARTLKELLNNLQAVFDRLVDNAMLSHGGKAAIFNAMHYIWNHVGGDLSLKTIAEHVYLSPTYLCALFKNVTGQTINQYIQMTRVERAQKLLEETELSMSEIAQTVGYQNMRYFAKVFQSTTGQQPSAYRRRWRNA